jgi:hypothetical protein
VEKRCTQATQRKDLQGEDDLGDIVGVPNNEPGRSDDGSTNKLPEEESTKEAKGILGLGLTGMAKRSTKDEPKDQGIDSQHDEWGEKGPEEAQHGASVALLHLTPCELDDEVPVPEEVPGNPPWQKEIEP